MTTDRPFCSYAAVLVFEQGDGDAEELRERYRELLEELRVIIPGVQVLFAFLLTVPFSARFDQLDHLGRVVFTGALLGVAVATVVFLTPAAIHRVSRDNDRRERLHLAIRFTVLGMAIVGASVAAAVFVVARFIFDNTPVGAVSGAAIAGLAVALWFIVPILRHEKGS